VRRSCCWPWISQRLRLWDEAREARARARAARRRSRRRDYSKVVESKSVCFAFEDLEAPERTEDGLEPVQLELPLMRPLQRHCVICLQDFQDQDQLRQLLPCEHLYHQDCVDGWFKAKRRPVCPVCNLPLDERELPPTQRIAWPRLVAGVPPAADQGLELPVPDAPRTGGTCELDGTPASQASTAAGSPVFSEDEDAHALLAGAAA